jgi:fructose-1,6-bisphosphatase/inositol monophosphatase family enzyme
VNDTTRQLVDLCAGLRAVVLPSLGSHAARDHAGVAVGGDVTFGIDEEAERYLVDHMRERLPGWAFYSEDGGLQGAADPDIVLIVDPIDGTRPAVVLAGVLAELIDTSSVGGSVFDIGSATYSVTRILTGQLDAYVDIGPAIIAAHPALEAEFRRVGRGHVLCNSPYDLAAVHLLCREAGVPIGDADGAPLDGRPVLGSDATYQMACIASGNAELQGRLVEVVQRGIGEYVHRGAAR